MKKGLIVKLKKALYRNGGKSFIINQSWPHFVVSREEIDRKYSLFDKKFIYDYKYKKDPMGIRGMFDYCSSINDRASIQYPRERFIRTHKDEL